MNGFCGLAKKATCYSVTIAKNAFDFVTFFKSSKMLLQIGNLDSRYESA